MMRDVGPSMGAVTIEMGLFTKQDEEEEPDDNAGFFDFIDEQGEVASSDSGTVDVEHLKEEQPDARDDRPNTFLHRDESISQGLEPSKEKLPMSPLSDLHTGVENTEEKTEIQVVEEVFLQLEKPEPKKEPRKPPQLIEKLFMNLEVTKQFFENKLIYYRF